MKKRVIGCLVVIISLLSMPVLAQETQGMPFLFYERYQAEEILPTLPLTAEALVWIPAEAERGGTIIGNYPQSNTVDSFNFEIRNGGCPRLYVIDDEKNTSVISFNEVHLPSNTWVHVAIVLDPVDNTASCYLDGVRIQTLSDVVYPMDVKIDVPLCLGGDLRDKSDLEYNAEYFKGKISYVALYRDQRTEAELAVDARSDFPAIDDMLAGYTPRLNADGTTPDVIADLSENGNDMVCLKAFVDVPAVEDYDYAFAVIGDTQYQNDQYPDVFFGLYDWIAEHAKEQKIAFVFGLGDITDRSSSEEWERAKTVIHQLDGVVPYSLVRGNHDTKEMFQKTFSMSEYQNVIAGSYDGSMLNTYQTFCVNGVDYLTLTLEYNPLVDVLKWADEVVAQHPNHRVIITTHDYIGDDAELSTAGEKIWENLVKKHPNIELVLNGHHGEDAIQFSQLKGDHGNVVTAMMINSQYKDLTFDGLGMVTMLYVSDHGKNVQLRHYSTAKKQYYRAVNQFDFVLNPDEIKIQFEDIAGHWGEPYILSMASKELIKGKSRTIFEPDSRITRAEFLTMALNTAGIETTNGESYTDVTMKSWFSPAIATAKKLGLIDERMVLEDYFYPDNDITREEMTAIIAKFCEVKNLTVPTGHTVIFTDRALFSDWTAPYIEKAAAMGVITGNPDGTFFPQGNATRAEAAVIFSRLLDLL